LNNFETENGNHVKTICFQKKCLIVSKKEILFATDFPEVVTLCMELSWTENGRISSNWKKNNRNPHCTANTEVLQTLECALIISYSQNFVPLFAAST